MIKSAATANVDRALAEQAAQVREYRRLYLHLSLLLKTAPEAHRAELQARYDDLAKRLYGAEARA